MRCSVVRDCEEEAAYYLAPTAMELAVELEDSIFVVPEPNVVAFACLHHMELCLDRGVSPEVFWSIKKVGSEPPPEKRAL